MTGVCAKKEVPAESSRSVGLSRRFVHAGMLMTGVRLLNYIFCFARLIILARLLTPRDFGLFGLCLVAVQLMKVFSKSGFWAALLQRQDDIRPYFDTYFIVSVIRGVFLAVALFAGAGMISGLLGAPEAKSLLRIVCLCFITQGLTSPAMVNYWRRLHLKKECIYQIVGTIVDLTVAIVAAIILRSAWALVLGLVAKNVIQLILSYILAPYRITGRWSLLKAKQLFSFGGWIFAISVLLFLLEHGIMLFVGRVLGVSALGFYVLAYQIGNRPTREFITVLTRPAFVAFSSIQNDVERLRAGYLKTFQFISSVTIPASVGIAVLAENLTAVFLGERWMHIVGVLTILALWSGLQSLNISGYALLKGVGKPSTEFRLRLYQIIPLVVIAWPLSQRLGLLGVGVALFLSEMVISPMMWHKLCGIIGCREWLQLRLILFPAIASLFMATAIWYAMIFFNNSAGVIDLVALTAIGIFVYTGCILIMGNLFNYDLAKLIRQNIARAFVKEGS